MTVFRAQPVSYHTSLLVSRSSFKVHQSLRFLQKVSSQRPFSYSLNISSYLSGLFIISGQVQDRGAFKIGLSFSFLYPTWLVFFISLKSVNRHIHIHSIGAMLLYLSV
ncbi:hypothetical protein BJX68DRAFT_131995 [Aspergillus pseudodeflectus]|uniref:Uncharacterized protein n=1 Tax=Aspergillus pseudodeflectus TaxID=176178 RepID=A0ABR4K3U5_9EURO